MFDDGADAQINNDLVRAAYAMTGSVRAAGRLIGLSAGTVSDHVKGYDVVGTDETGRDITRSRGFSESNVAAMSAALDRMDASTLERLTAAQALLAGRDEAAAQGYALWLKANPSEFQERVTRAQEFAELQGLDLQDLAVEGIGS